MADETKNPAGSVWHRWDPHLHMPGTRKNDQFGPRPAADAEYIRRLLAWTPSIRVLGVTDYYLLDCYERAVQWKKDGKLPGVELIFANVELRFQVNAPRGSPVNLHLLISPDDPEHVSKLNKFLSKLHFNFKGENYGCDRGSLIDLGKAIGPATTDEEALKIGVEQHKVSPDNLIQEFETSEWARKNIVVGMAASSTDGSGQLRESGLAAVRLKLEHLADVIFSSNASDRAFWLGAKAPDLAAFKTQYGGLKPCLHGCDAHKIDDIGHADFDRFTWLKGDLTFETLRQACLEPSTRAYIGAAPPKGALPSNAISEVKIADADWLEQSSLCLNSGLVAIIGARGSGKTALAEMVAAGANAIERRHAERSFLERAKTLVRNASVSLIWGEGSNTTSVLKYDALPATPEAPRARYLSQKFVDNLCSSEGLTDELVTEIERVIFQAHAPDDRLDSVDFDDLRDARTGGVRRAKQRQQELLTALGRELSTERDMQDGLKELVELRALATAALDRDKKDRLSLTPSGDIDLVKLLEKIRAAAEAKAASVARLQRQKLDLESLKEEVDEFGGESAHVRLADLKAQYPFAGLSDADWERFGLSYDKSVGVVIGDRLMAVSTAIGLQQGPARDERAEAGDPASAPAYVSPDDTLADQTLTLLRKEQRRLEARIGVDETRRRRYAELSAKIAKAEADLAKRDKDIEKAKGASARITQLMVKREAAYRALFTEIEREERLLQELYKPLQDRLQNQSGSLSKLSFSVHRKVDAQSWADAGERLLDLSRAGAFRGAGTLLETAAQRLVALWEEGGAAEIAKAVAQFRTDFATDFMTHMPRDARQSREAKTAWLDQLTNWLFGTDHIEIVYGLEYEGTDIQQLSPGTRGIVLLLLYLSIDLDDDRPLIIDQPEENLDPKSIFDELVSRFREARFRRQIIIVTHNANLVVNTDADQVIIAERGSHREGALPMMTYRSGGLESAEIRAAVCDILEGGQEAFLERARRLRVALEA